MRAYRISILLIYPIIMVMYSCKDINEGNTISLAGTWSLQIDPNDVGYKINGDAQPINLPGSLQEAGYGDDVTINTPWTGAVHDQSWFNDDSYAEYRKPGNIKIPFWLTPEKYYAGKAYYVRTIDIPQKWEGHRILFTFERAHWFTTLYVDEEEIGKGDALGTPHRFISHPLTAGQHKLIVAVDNRLHIDVGSNAHSVSDHTQTNWNGLIGELSMKPLPNIAIRNVSTYPDANTNSVRVVIALDGHPTKGTIELIVSHEGRQVVQRMIKLSPDDGPEVSTILELNEDALPWSEFTPNLYHLEACLKTDDGMSRCLETFGFRQLSIDGTQFTLNGKPLFLRGTLECCIFPLTGYPSLDPAYWRKIYSTCQSYGLNHMRFHSWCPPEVAFAVADTMGVYLQVESSAWTWLSYGQPIDQWIYDESDRILSEYGNHPSFCFLAHGNEPEGDGRVQYLTKLIKHWRKIDNGRRLYTGGSGWPYLDAADYWSTFGMSIGSIGLVDNILNNQEPNTEFDFSSKISKNMPTIGHEVGQWCVYPDLKETSKYTGVLKAKNFEIFQQRLIDNKMGDMAEKLLYASGRLQTLAYKADIESSLRTPGYAGFQLLDLHDFPGQGTALVGLLNPFWDSKGYVDEEEFSMFCNRTVPLARMKKLVWMNDELFEAKLECTHYDAVPIEGATISWSIKHQDGKVLAAGETKHDIAVGTAQSIGEVSQSLKEITQPEQLTFELSINETMARNKWNIWVYPSSLTEPKTLPYITSHLDREALSRLERGENVLLTAYGNVAQEWGGNIRVAFSPIYWNTAWTNNVPPHTLGLINDPTHPAFSQFPGEGWSNYQWQNLMTRCSAMDMKLLPDDCKPLVYIIDDWFKGRRLAALFECRVCEGKLMVCSFDIENDLDSRPSARQFRHSILNYMASEEFSPQEEISPDDIKQIIL